MYQLITIEEPGLILYTSPIADLRGAVQDILAWAGENGWKPAKYDNDPDADCLIQHHLMDTDEGEGEDEDDPCPCGAMSALDCAGECECTGTTTPPQPKP